MADIKTRNKSSKLPGLTWTLVNHQRGYPLRAVTNDGSKFVAVGDYGTLWTSPDGIHWTRRAPNRTNTFDLHYAESTFVVAGARGFVATSSDGIKWREQRTPVSIGLWGVGYGAGTWVVTGNKGTILTSRDGVSWTQRQSPTSRKLLDVTYGHNGFVIVGGSGYILTSADGINWSQSFRAETGLVSVAYGRGLYLAGGRSGGLYTSSDGVKWTRRNTGTKRIIQDIIDTGSNYVAAGAYGILFTSPGGKHWTRRESGAVTTIMGLDRMDDTCIGVGLSGQVTLSMANTPGKAGIVVASPNGTETWTPGEKKTIRWGSYGSVGKVKIEYSTNGGRFWTTIVPAVVNKGSYTWKIPHESSDRCQVRVSEANGSISGVSNAYFTIPGPKNDTRITLTSPNGGEKLIAGQTHTIKWKGSRTFSGVDIEYNNGTSWIPIVSGIPDEGFYDWIVPDISSTGAGIWIKGYDGDITVTDRSDEPFTIERQEQISQPDGFKITDADISFNSTDGAVNYIDIRLKIEPGSGHGAGTIAIGK